MKFTRFAALAAVSLALGAGVSTSAEAAGLKVLFLGGDDGSVVQATMTDILTGDARFDLANSAAYSYVDLGNPTLGQLQQFDAVLYWSNQPQNSALGDELADYADGGGRVVLTTFLGWDAANGYGSNGRLDSAGYNPLTGPTVDAYNSTTLGAHDATSPLMQGVNSLSSSFYNSDFTGVASGATLVASWDNARPLEAYNAAQNVIGITLFPSVSSYGGASGDYRPLFDNALAFTGSASAAPEPAAWALMIAGFGLAGAALRRRAKLATA